MSHLLLSHLSKNNNSVELVQQLFNAHAENVKVIVASRHQETEVFQICIDETLKELRVEPRLAKPPLQLSLSFA
jgi:hypothetical protein